MTVLKTSLVIVTFCLLSGWTAVDSTEDKYLLQKECVDALQKQINDELHASLVYLNMAAHFHHTTVARKGFFRFFQDQSDEEKKHAHKLIHYVNKRGGTVKTFDVQMPDKSNWASASEAVRDAIELEKELNIRLHVLHTSADRLCKDPHLMDFLESEFLEEQVSSISQLSKLLTTLTSFGEGNQSMGEFLVDKELVDEKTRKYYEDEL